MEKAIIWEEPSGIVAVLIPSQSSNINDLLKTDVPEGIAAQVINVSDIPKESMFQPAWKIVGEKIEVSIDACRDIAHQYRRISREKEFFPLDLKATVPALAEQAEISRQGVRDKYAEIQAEIDAAETPEAIKKALEGI